jgi:hypothetical protein
MAVKSLIDVFWIAGMGLQGMLAVVLLSKTAWKRYPFFTGYSLFNFIVTVSFYFLQHQPKLFFYSYWIQETVTIVLGFGVFYEIFQHLFSSHKALLKLASLIFRWTVVVLFCVGLVVVLAQSPSAGSLSKTVLLLEEGMRIVEVGLLMFLFGASAAFGLHWKQAEFGIALGLGLFVAVELTAVALRSQIGLQGWQVLNIVRILSFDLSLLVWLGYLLVPERVPGSADVPKRAQLEQWNQAVMELISR